jgi:hypothetical protein
VKHANNVGRLKMVTDEEIRNEISRVAGKLRSFGCAVDIFIMTLRERGYCDEQILFYLNSWLMVMEWINRAIDHYYGNIFNFIKETVERFK